jgi:hypothetical protein
MDLFSYTKLTDRFERAMAEAFRLHRAQERKGSRVPYMGHLLGTAGLVLHFGGTEDQAIGALLHDAAEDCGGRPVLDAIRERFGPEVAEIVEGCTDTFETPKPDWRPRKEAYVRGLATKPAATLLVSAADKLDNARAIVADLRVHGEKVWDRFSAGRDVLWYYETLVEAFENRAVGPIVDELAAAVGTMQLLASAGASRSPVDDARLVVLLAEQARIRSHASSPQGQGPSGSRASRIGSSEGAAFVDARMRALDAAAPLAEDVRMILEVTARTVQYTERCRELLRALAKTGRPKEVAGVADLARGVLGDDTDWALLQSATSTRVELLSRRLAALLAALLQGDRR